MENSSKIFYFFKDKKINFFKDKFSLKPYIVLDYEFE